METILIRAKINRKNKTEFYQTIESLEKLIKDYCSEFVLEESTDNNLMIRVTFADKDELLKNFYNKEFTILKGSIRSLCNSIDIKLNNGRIEIGNNGFN